VLNKGQMSTGGKILLASSALAALLVIAGLGYAMGAGARSRAALIAAGCEPSLSPSGQQCTTTQMLASRYLAIVTSASQQLSAGTAAYNASEGARLGAAEAALTAEVTSEHAFGTSLAGIAFPPAIAPMAKALARANQARAELTAEQARSSSLTRMRSFNHRLQAADATVQTDMNLISKALNIRTKGQEKGK
jgi:hypothetical protein